MLDFTIKYEMIVIINPINHSFQSIIGLCAGSLLSSKCIFVFIEACVQVCVFSVCMSMTVHARVRACICARARLRMCVCVSTCVGARVGCQNGSSRPRVLTPRGSQSPIIFINCIALGVYG